MLEITKKFPKKRAFITGCGSGLGRAFCLALAKDGWTIGMTDNNGQALHDVGEEVKQLGGTPLLYEFDVTNDPKFHHAAATFLADTNGIDLLINNAGVGDGERFEQYELVHWFWLLEINLHAVIKGTKLFTHTLLSQKQGAILNIGSAAGFVNPPAMSAYNVSKAGVISFSETLHYEWKNRGIHVSVLMPTFFKTNIMTQAKGGPMIQAFANKMMEQSRISAAEVAHAGLDGVARNRINIVLPREAKIRWYMKRFIPSLLSKYIHKHYGKLDRRA